MIHRIDSNEFRNIARDPSAPASAAMLRAWDVIATTDPPELVAKVHVQVQSGSVNETLVPRQQLRRFISRLLLDLDVKYVVIDDTRLPL